MESDLDPRSSFNRLNDFIRREMAGQDIILSDGTYFLTPAFMYRTSGGWKADPVSFGRAIGEAYGIWAGQSGLSNNFNYNALLQGARDAGTYADLGAGVFGLGQIGMLEYRQSLSIGSKTGTFGRFSRVYRGVGLASRTMGRVSYATAPLSVYLDYTAMQKGEISGAMFTYRTVGIGSSIGGGAAIGSAFGGPWGAVGGAAIGGAF